MIHHIYPDIFNLGRLDKGVMALPFLHKNEDVFKNWTNISQVSRYEFVNPVEVQCYVKNTDNVSGLYISEPAVFAIESVASFNAYVFFKKNTGKLIVFALFSEVYSVNHGTFTLDYGENPILKITTNT